MTNNPLVRICDFACRADSIVSLDLDEPDRSITLTLQKKSEYDVDIDRLFIFPTSEAARDKFREIIVLVNHGS